jgi:anaerobic ribonucleoside-triphosphate reductase
VRTIDERMEMTKKSIDGPIEKTKEMVETTDKQTMQMMGIPSTTVVVVSMKTTITRKTMMQKIIVQIQ